MNRIAIALQLNEILSEMELGEVDYRNHHANLKQFLVMDSLDFAELVIKVEQRFRITILEDRLSELETFEDLIDMVLDLKSA